MPNLTDNYSGTNTANANKIFDDMLLLTRRLFCLSAKDSPCSRGTKKRWVDLADIWVKYANQDCDYSIFEMALHRIYWGVYPDYTENRHIPLLKMVEKELLSNGLAYNAWKYHKAYRYAFDFVKNQDKALVSRGPRPHSYIFACYQNSRFWFKVVYKGQAPGCINPTMASMHDLRAAKKHADIYAVCDGFEKAINCLIPASASWTDEQWLNDLNICRALKQLYGITYKNYDRNFEILITGLMNKLHYNAPVYLAQLLGLSSLPMSIVQQIWPDGTTVELNKLFLQAGSRAQCAERRLRNSTSCRTGHYSYQKLQNSWLYAYIYNAFAHASPQDELGKKVKSRLFKVAANIV
jgi:hypothetical protein